MAPHVMPAGGGGGGVWTHVPSHVPQLNPTQPTWLPLRTNVPAYVTRVFCNFYRSVDVSRFSSVCDSSCVTIP
ncbi:hypothetical protein V6N12_017259 [Hibiscus sabdariffa]|uniref:Uncharacterized protein n=1 Tax=Hibiscus sabdariffa TaxID=183260 RepID=A0ABR2CFD6_9ROSI